MSSATLIRFALLGSAALAAASGCGTRASAPRLLEVPADVRPIGASPVGNFPREMALSAPAQYEQPQASVGDARITEVLPAPGATEARTIREPAAGPVQAPIAQPATPPRRSEFVPISMPRDCAPAFAATAPELPVAGDFARAASQPASGLVEGPQLTRPESSGWAGPSVPSPENAGRAWSFAAQPAAPAAPAGHERGPQSMAITPVSSGGSARAIDSRPQGMQGVQPSEQRVPMAAMQAISQRAMQMAEQATAMANRGMLYSAHAELVQALALVAQSLDMHEGTVQHAAALNAGITALAEAREFAATNIRGGEAVNVGAIAAGHRTPILRASAGAGLSAVVAQQQYFGYAQAQLTLAAGNVPAGSQVLYRLGRLQTAMSAHDADPQAMREPQAIVFHQAALASDRTNWLAANELGVLYARYGQLAEARHLLVHSVTVHSNLEGWHNLSVVHRRLGEADLAQKANAEWQLLAKQTGKTRSDASEMVRWVDPHTFAAGNGADAQWPASTAAKPVATQSTVRR